MNMHDAPVQQALSGDLLLRTATDTEDVHRVAEFNGQIHGRGVVDMTLDLFLRHPHTRLTDLLYVEDIHSKVIVSSLCLIPWQIAYDNVTFTSGEMGIVGTLEPYRRRGLIRAQVDLFRRRLRDRGCVLSHIQGIAYYYRQFGFEYAMPLEGGIVITQRDVPKHENMMPYTFRQANQNDIPVLTLLFETAAEDLLIHVIRDEPTWRYLLERNTQSDMDAETWIVLNAQGHVAGYFRLPEHHFGEELTVNEASKLSFESAWAVLDELIELAEQHHTPGVRLCLPQQSDLMRVARSFGVRDLGTYAWQIMMPSPVDFLQTIATALESRITRSIFAGLTRDLTISFFRYGVRLHFEAGRLTNVTYLDQPDHSDMHMPPNAFAPLALGYRSFDELRTNYPDAGVSPACRLFVDTLFPRSASFLYTIY